MMLLGKSSIRCFIEQKGGELIAMNEQGFIGANTPLMQELFKSFVDEYGVINNDIITNIQQLTDAFTTGIAEYKGDCAKIQGLIDTTSSALKTSAEGIEGNWYGHQKDQFSNETAELLKAMTKLSTAFTEFSSYFEEIKGKLDQVTSELKSAVTTAGDCTNILADDVKTFKQNLGIIDE